MSAAKSNSNGCASGACGCASKGESKSSSSEAKSSSPSATKTESKASTPAKAVIQNGKGSAPRNVGPQFKRNFGRIKWSDEKRQRREGYREVKVYG